MFPSYAARLRLTRAPWHAAITAASRIGGNPQIARACTAALTMWFIGDVEPGYACRARMYGGEGVCSNWLATNQRNAPALGGAKQDVLDDAGRASASTQICMVDIPESKPWSEVTPISIGFSPFCFFLIAAPDDGDESRRRAASLRSPTPGRAPDRSTSAAGVPPFPASVASWRTTYGSASAAASCGDARRASTGVGRRFRGAERARRAVLWHWSSRFGIAARPKVLFRRRTGRLKSVSRRPPLYLRSTFMSRGQMSWRKTRHSLASNSCCRCRRCCSSCHRPKRTSFVVLASSHPSGQFAEPLSGAVRAGQSAFLRQHGGVSQVSGASRQVSAVAAEGRQGLGKSREQRPGGGSW